MDHSRKFVVIDRLSSGGNPGTVFGLDTRVLRVVYTLGICYLIYVLRDVLLLLVLSVVAYILFPVVEGTFRFVTHKRHRGTALVIVFVAILTVLLAIGGVIGYFAFEQASADVSILVGDRSD